MTKRQKAAWSTKEQPAEYRSSLATRGRTPGPRVTVMVVPTEKSPTVLFVDELRSIEAKAVD
jgi:hypothetical protein